MGRTGSAMGSVAVSLLILLALLSESAPLVLGLASDETLVRDVSRPGQGSLKIGKPLVRREQSQPPHIDDAATRISDIDDKNGSLMQKNDCDSQPANCNSPIKLISGWKWYGGTWEKPNQLRESPGICVLEGLIKPTSPTTSTVTIAELESWCRPVLHIPLVMQSNGGAARVDVLSTGAVILRSSAPLVSRSWISLEASFGVTSGGTGTTECVSATAYCKKAIPLTTGSWQNYGHGWEAPTVRKVPLSECVLQGLARTSRRRFVSSSCIAILDWWCRPAGDEVLIMETDKGPQRVDVKTTGRIEVVSMKPNTQWVSIEATYGVASA